MRAVDTNVVVRYLKNDDAAQAAKARALIDGEPVYLSLTVLLETEWVLRYTYGHKRSDVARALRLLVDHPNVEPEDRRRTVSALNWASEPGLDLADALHLAGASRCASFVTFDKKLARKGQIVEPGRVQLL